MRHTFRPSPWSSRWRSSSSSPVGKPFSSSQGRGGTWVNTAVTRADLAPVRMSSRLVRSPSTAPMESMTMDLPAPVSPVSTLNPGSNRMSADWMRAIFSM